MSDIDEPNELAKSHQDTIRFIVSRGYDLTKRNVNQMCCRIYPHICLGCDGLYRNLIHNIIFNSHMIDISSNDGRKVFSKKFPYSDSIFATLITEQSIISKEAEFQVLTCWAFINTLTRGNFFFCLRDEYTFEEIDNLIRSEEPCFPITVNFDDCHYNLFTTSYDISRGLILAKVTTTSRRLHKEIIQNLRGIEYDWSEEQCLIRPKMELSVNCPCEVCQTADHYERVLILYENALKQEMSLFEILMKKLNLDKEDYRSSKRPRSESLSSSRPATIQRI
jgi:hypothetical protein